VQRYDAFFKRIFKQFINPFLELLNVLIPYDIGNKVATEPLSEEVSKGVLRADMITKTNKGYILIFEFKEEIGIDAYSAISAYTSSHAHTTKAYSMLLAKRLDHLPYIPIIAGFSFQRRYRDYLEERNEITEHIRGFYSLATSPYYSIYAFVFNKIDLISVILEVVRKYPDLKEHYHVLKTLNTIEFWKKALKDSVYAETAIKILEHFGELILLAKHDPTYFRSVWQFSKSYSLEFTKDILNLTAIIFLKKEVELFMSLAELLTFEEKKKVIEAIGIDVAIEVIGLEKVVGAVGLEKVIETVGLEKVIEAIGLEKVIAVKGVDAIIDQIIELVREGKVDKRVLDKLKTLSD